MLKIEKDWAQSAVFYQIYPLGFCGAPFHNDGVTVPRISQSKGMDSPSAKTGHWRHLLFPGVRIRFPRLRYPGLPEDSTAGWAPMRILRKSVTPCMKRVSGWCWTACSTMWAGASGLSRMCCDKREASSVSGLVPSSISDGNNGYNDGLWYEGWEGHFELVKLNLRNPAVVDYLLESRPGQWVEEFDIDGLRLDVAYLLDENFMRRLHSYVRAKDEGFFLLGEMIHGDYKRIVNPEMLDSATNYECYKGLYSSL